MKTKPLTYIVDEMDRITQDMVRLNVDMSCHVIQSRKIKGYFTTQYTNTGMYDTWDADGDYLIELLNKDMNKSREEL